MRALAGIALIIGVILIPTALGVAKLDRDHRVAAVESMLVAETKEHGIGLDAYFQQARSMVLLTASSPAFANVLAQPGTRAQKLRRQGRNLAEVTHQLGYLERLDWSGIEGARFIDAHGDELARVVRGKVAPPDELSTQEERAPYFAPTFALKFGQTHQTRPYVSPHTKEWVIGNATLVPQRDGRKRAVVEVELTIESFRYAMGRGTARYDLRIVDARTGRVVTEGRHPQRVGAPLGAPGDRRFAELADRPDYEGIDEVEGHKIAYRRVGESPRNANRWIVVARAKEPIGGFVATMGAVPIAMLAIALLIIVLSGGALRAARRELEAHAMTDALTGLGNRRKLLADLERRVRTATPQDPALLTMFDLNGFKNYNDSFGHPVGDALLLRLGSALEQAVAPFGGRAYRQGGDEFCVIAGAEHRHAIEQAAFHALSANGDGFDISTAFGSVVIPHEARDATEALRRADQAMYAQKHSGRATAGRQSTDVLLRVLTERDPELGHHLEGVTDLVGRVGEHLDINGEELAQMRHAAALHDIGKIAIPTSILTKPAALNAEEWAFVHRHTVIGERIIAAAPALSRAARLVRSSHEAFDGGGYPDGLAGEEIPLGARIIAVCDAFDAMISNRPYSRAKTTDEALAELRRCSGTQFDPEIVEAFEQAVTQRPTAGSSA